MKNNWIIKDGVLFKETEEKFSVISYLTWVLNNDDNDKVYLPTLHHIDKKSYSKEAIEDLIKQNFNGGEGISFCWSIALLSPFIGECIDILDENDKSIQFKCDEEDIMPNLFSIAEKFNL